MALNCEFVRIQRCSCMIMRTVKQHNPIQVSNISLNWPIAKSILPIYGYLNNLKLPFISKQSKAPKEDYPKWKKKNILSKASIDARTRHVVSSIKYYDTKKSLIKRLEELTIHLNEYPEAKNLATKEEAISFLLYLRRMELQEEDIKGALRQALSLLGHVDPVPGRGIRILSIDGGGTRGLLVVEMLRKLEKITGRRIFELFDFVCGVSTGAILACLIGPHKKSSEECSIMYKEISAKIFNQSRLWGTGSLVWSDSYYNNQHWEALLRDYIGKEPLWKTSRDPSCPKLAAISTIVNKEQVFGYVFRNYNLPYGLYSEYIGSSQHLMWEAVRASSAAPPYFGEYCIGEFVHLDGGILVNNPTAVAIHEARRLWPDTPLQCVLSLGTGRKKYAGMPLPHFSRTRMAELAGGIEGELIGLIAGPTSAKDTSSSSNSAASSWKSKCLKILDSATDTEGVHTILSDLLPRGVYYRFNPHLTEEISLDEIRPEYLKKLETDAYMYVRRNEETFYEVADALLAPKTLLQKCVDWLKLRYLEGLPSVLNRIQAKE